MNTKHSTTFASLAAIAVFFGAALIKEGDFLTEKETPFTKQIRGGLSHFQTAFAEDRLSITTDRPLYEPGSTIRLNVAVRDGGTLKPSLKSRVVYAELVGPSGVILKSAKYIANEGMAHGAFELDESLPGGIYKIRTYTNWKKNEGDQYYEERQLMVQKVVLPRIKFELEFERKSYQGSESAGAYVQLTDNTNRPLRRQKVTYSLLRNGAVTQTYTAISDEEGVVNMRVQLPGQIKKGDLSLTVETIYEGQTESIQQPIPILSEEVQVSFYPEGGELVDGMHSVVAFSARNKEGQPVEVEGQVVDSHQKTITNFSTAKNGMGYFKFTPLKNEQYYAVLHQGNLPVQKIALPEALPNGVVMHVAPIEEGISLHIQSKHTQTMSVVVQIRGEVYFTSVLPLKIGDNLFMIPTASMPSGVAQITLFDSKDIPRVERLSFVNLNKKYELKLKPLQNAYQPGEKVKVAVEVRDEKGMPAPANLCLSVVNDQLMSFANDKSGNLVSAMLLERDLNTKVSDPSYYFNGSADASVAMDLLMLTSGWRRFTWEQILENQFPLYTYPAEPGILSGIVYNGRTGKVLKEAEVYIGGKFARTDSEGRYVFNNLDLTQPLTLTVKYLGLNNCVMQVRDYSANFNCYLYDNAYQPRYDRVPVAADKFNNAEQQEGVAMALPAFAGNQNVEAKAVRVEKAKSVTGKKTIGYSIKRELASSMQLDTVLMRHSFDQTVFWKPDLKIGYSGKAVVEFTCNDLLSSFKIYAEGFGGGCYPIASSALFYTEMPFSVDIKLPTELVSGDEVMMPLTLKNRTEQPIGGVLKLNLPEGLNIIGKMDSVQTIMPRSSKVNWYKIKVGRAGIGNIVAQFAACGQTDAISVPVNIQQAGFPVVKSFSGKNLSSTYTFETKDMVQQSLKVKATIYPNLVTDIMSSVEGILQEPYGCFEQTSCTAYPNAMVLGYLKAMQSDNSRLVARATDLMDRGYNRLTTFETQAKGYEWFGSVPAHEGLTAYGLMEFADMQRAGQKIDEQMFNRTLNWLLSHKDGKGGFKRETHALHDFGRIDEAIMNGYIVYALSDAGCKDIEKEFRHSMQVAEERKDAYLLAMSCQAAFNLNKDEEGERLLKTLLTLMQDDGSFTGKMHSITYSLGSSLTIESTAMAVLAMLKSKNVPIDYLNKSLRYLISSRNARGYFGSTQGTILALKALSKAAQASSQQASTGEVCIYIDGKLVETQTVSSQGSAPVVLDHLESFCNKSGKHDIQIKFKNMKEALPYTLVAEWRTTLPQSDEACTVGLKTNLLQTRVNQGSSVRLNVVIQNKTSNNLPSTMVCIGIPGGLSVQPWQLKSYTEQGKFAHYEIKGGMLYLYYRGLAAFAKMEIPFDLKADLPGHYTAPASSAYLYYTNEFKSWVPAEKIEILP